MIAADKAGKTPQEFVAEVAAGRQAHLDGFGISFDNWSSTDAPENHALARTSTASCKKNELIAVKTVEQFFDPVKSMFLPDRYIKGECPVCGAKDQNGDSCEVCGSVYAPTDAEEPVLGALRRAPVLKSSEHYFFQLSSQRCLDFLKAWTQEPGRLQPEVLNKISEWFKVDEQGHGGLADWDISRDAPYFGIEIPDAPGKYFYVWLDAPIGYLARSRTTSTPARRRRRASRARSTSSWPTRRSSRCTSSARTSSTSTPCSGRRCCTSAAARCRTRCTCTASSPSAAARR
jgi:methionyl-tRNA synthetase